MKGILQRIRRERRLNLALAYWAVRLLRTNTSKPLAPHLLQELQKTNCEWRRMNDDERAEFKRRRGTRTRMITARFGSNQAVHQARREHDKAIRDLDGVFEQRESILYQIGDASAWAVLRGQTRLLLPLFRPGRAHGLPSGVGLNGPAHVASEAHGTGDFLVILNDLTRCISIGDLTVVWARRPWQHPSVYEVKTTEPDEAGQSTISLLGIEGGWPADIELNRDFQSKLGFTVQEPGPMDQRAQGQWKELASRAELMQDISASGLKPLRGKGGTLWKGLEVVLRSALQTGYSYDLLETGVYAIAVRNSNDDDLKAHFRAALTRLKDDIFNQTPGLKWGKASTWDLATKEVGAPLYAPMLLWRIAPDLAARLVAGELYLVGFIREDLWSNLFDKHRIDRKIDAEGNWRLQRDNALVTFSNVEVAKITAGVIFSGISPTAVADAVDADLTQQVASPQKSN